MKNLIFQTISQTTRNVYQMQFNSMRILVVLGLYVSLRVVKDEGVTNTETNGFSDQPGNQSPTRAPPNCADTKFPVTHFFLSSFSRCAQGSSSPNSLHHGTVDTSLSKMSPAVAEQWRHAALCFLTDLVQSMEH